MWPPKYSDLYSIPSDINYPSSSDITPDFLKSDTRFANLNSQDYASKDVKRCSIPPFFDFIEQNSEQNVILAANDLLNRQTEGIVIGYKRFEDIGHGIDSKIFEFRRDCVITGIHFMRDNLVIITLENGCIELWSTRCDNNIVNDYCPFKLVAKSRHMTPVSSSKFINEDKTTFLSGDLRGNVFVWDSGAADLDYTQSYSIYSSEVTGICAYRENENLFFSCSNHGESYVTDLRVNLKGSVLLNADDNIFTAIAAKDYYIFVGDFSGDVKIVDRRQSNREIKTIKVFDNSVKKIEINEFSHTFAALERGAQLKVLCSKDFKTVFKTMEKHMLRDMLWSGTSTINIIGWNSLFKTYNFALKNGQ